MLTLINIKFIKVSQLAPSTVCTINQHQHDKLSAWCSMYHYQIACVWINNTSTPLNGIVPTPALAPIMVSAPTSALAPLADYCCSSINRDITHNVVAWHMFMCRSCTHLACNYANLMSFGIQKTETPLKFLRAAAPSSLSAPCTYVRWLNLKPLNLILLVVLTWAGTACRSRHRQKVTLHRKKPSKTLRFEHGGRCPQN